MYWKIGRYISEAIPKHEWRKRLIEDLSNSIQKRYSGIKGFSPSNLLRMRQFYEIYKDSGLFATVLRKVSWSHNIRIMSLDSSKEREYYLRTTIRNKYSFRELERQIPLQVGESDFRIDLVFYHRVLKCLVAIELKSGKFKPEHLGQLNFYLEALDRQEKKVGENPSVGIILCGQKDDVVVEYALASNLKPSLVAQYKLYLPSKEMLEAQAKLIAQLKEEVE